MLYKELWIFFFFFSLMGNFKMLSKTNHSLQLKRKHSCCFQPKLNQTDYYRSQGTIATVETPRTRLQPWLKSSRPCHHRNLLQRTAVDHFLRTTSKVLVTKLEGPGVLLPSPHKTLPTPATYLASLLRAVPSETQQKGMCILVLLL